MSRRARTTDPVTSWAAARNANPDLDQSLRSVILSALSCFGPQTHDDLIEIVSVLRPCSPSGVRTRTKELVDLGELERVPDMVAKSRYGRASLLWQVVPEGSPRCRTCNSRYDIEYGYCVSCDPGDGQTGE
jgi:hypothetical protein